MDPRTAAAALVVALAVVLALCVPAGNRVAAQVAVDWLIVAVPVLLAALGRPITRG